LQVIISRKLEVTKEQLKLVEILVLEQQLVKLKLLWHIGLVEESRPTRHKLEVQLGEEVKRLCFKLSLFMLLVLEQGLELELEQGLEQGLRLGLKLEQLFELRLLGVGEQFIFRLTNIQCVQLLFLVKCIQHIFFQWERIQCIFFLEERIQ
jgi:hypothetical protein